MRYSTTSALVLGAFAVGEVVAGPTHAHMHRHAQKHAKKDVDWDSLDWNNMGIDWTSAWKAGQHSTVAPVAVPTPAATTAAAAPAVTTAAAAAANNAAAAAPSAASAAASGTGDFLEDITTEVSLLWNGLVGKANHVTSFGKKTSTSGTEVGYIGNVGSPLEGSNMMLVNSVGDYQFTNEFINTSGQTMTVVIWNKAASPGMSGSLAQVEANLGASIAPKTAALTFVLKPKQSQIVAFDESSTIGWAQATSNINYAGQFATTWGEGNFQSAGSGYDVSAIQNSAGNNYNMIITSVEAPSCTSDKTQNMWLTDTTPVGGSDGSCFISQSTAHLTTKMGGTS